MELYIILAVGFFLALALGGGNAQPEPQVIYVVAPERRGGAGGTLLGAAIFVALVAYLLGTLPA